ncbi:hypothetical protein NITLEN_10211 [Nitrospira lenta]|uniref:Uncharacterized protein n=1 Tax=Nitrospira lenta TaxID=1436998 RepID=A0A330L037_9BACT|nr:hypothetical protein NITLEN_10211 [Nitrospira lenta]
MPRCKGCGLAWPVTPWTGDSNCSSPQTAMTAVLGGSSMDYSAGSRDVETPVDMIGNRR